MEPAVGVQAPKTNTYRLTPYKEAYFFVISLEIKAKSILVTFTLLPAVFIIWKDGSTVRIVFFLHVGHHDVPFFFPLVQTMVSL